MAASPLDCRQAGGSPLARELGIAFGGSGTVALFEVIDGHTVIIGAIRHQGEDDYH